MFVKLPARFKVPDVEVSVPALIVSAPSVAVPLPKLKVAVPTLVRSCPPVIPALPKVILPVVPMLLALPKVIVPLYVAAVAEPLINAPPDEIPVPFNVRALAVESVYPFKSNTAPELTVVADEVPSAVVDPRFKVPAFIEVVPE